MGAVTVSTGVVTVVGGCVTVCVGCLMLMFVVELVVDGRCAALDTPGAVCTFPLPLPSDTASATATPMAATAMTPKIDSHSFDRERRRAPQFGQDSAFGATGVPQFGQKPEPEGGGEPGEGG